MSHYNPWPLGALPASWQRPEPRQLREAGYHWDDPRDINAIFETKLAQYAGAKHAVLTDCCTNAVFLSLLFEVEVGSLRSGTEIFIPDRTYVSIPQAIYHAGLKPQLVSKEWSGAYSLEGSLVIDGAGRFTSGMYTEPNAMHCLSFQIKKRLPIGRGGVVLTNNSEAAEWIRLATYDGRNLMTPYDSPSHVTRLGWHMYMTPEDAARGILLMDQIGKDNEDTMSYKNYPAISTYSMTPDEWKCA